MTSNHSRTDSRPGRAGGAGDGDTDRPLAAGSLALAAASGLLSLLGYAALPGQVRVHWTLGAGPYYGPEFAPKLLVVALFPVLVVGTALAARVALHRVRAAEGPATRPYDTAVVLGALALVVAVQAALLVANL